MTRRIRNVDVGSLPEAFRRIAESAIAHAIDKTNSPTNVGPLKEWVEENIDEMVEEYNDEIAIYLSSIAEHDFSDKEVFINDPDLAAGGRITDSHRVEFARQRIAYVREDFDWPGPSIHYVQLTGGKSWLGEFAQGCKWRFCLTPAKMAG